MDDASARRPGSRQLGLLWGGAALGLILASPLAPHFAGGLWSCLTKTWLGLPCPGCGTTRAALDLARLDFLHAFSHYPLPALAWTLFLLGGLTAGALTLAGRELPAPPRRLPAWAKITAVGAVLANWAYSLATGV